MESFRFSVLVVIILSLASVVFSQAPVYSTAIQNTHAQNWATAQSKATTLVNSLSTAQKVSIVAGIGGSVNRKCAYMTANMTGTIPFPGMCIADGPLGVRVAFNVSAFPAGVNIAQTWNRTLMYLRGNAMGVEFKGKGANVAMGPHLNMARTAAGGRNWEGFGGDPYLAGEAAYQTVFGIQDAGVISCMKHAIGNEQENYRSSENSMIDDRTAHEIYFYPFMKGIRAGAASAMCSFNQVNGTFSCQNSNVLNSILRGQLGFKGFILSDWDACYSSTCINAGLDMTQPDAGEFTTSNINSWISSGSITSTQVTTMATNIISSWYFLNQDQNYPIPTLAYSNNGLGAPFVNVASTAHGELIREIGGESAVLLKNSNQQLPLSTTSGLTVAVIGQDAGMPSNLNSLTGANYVDGTVAMGWGSGTAFFPYLITPLAAVQAAFGSSNVKSTLNNWDLTNIQNVAKTQNIAIVCVNVDSGEGYISVDGNVGDRNNISLWYNGDNVIEAVASVNAHTIVVLHITGPVLMPWLNNPNVTAVLLAGLPGQETGNSMVDVLTGVVNPSGKLVYTISNLTDYPAQVLYSSSASNPPINYTEALKIDYRWFDTKNIEPLFPFGFGLSYTTFTYSNFVTNGWMQNQVLAGIANDTSTVLMLTATIKNTGTVAGAEIVQLYIAYPESLGEPPRILKGFEKVYLTAGQSLPVQFNLTGLDLSIWDIVKQNWTVNLGNYTAYLAASSRDLRLSLGFSVVNEFNLIEVSSTTTTTSKGTTTTTTGVKGTTSAVSTSTGRGTTSASASSVTTGVKGSTSSVSTSSSSSSSVTSSTSTGSTGSSSSSSSSSNSTVSSSSTSSSSTTGTPILPKKDPSLWSKVGLAWPDGEFSNLWALAGNGWNQVAWIHSYSAWEPLQSILAVLDFVPTLGSCDTNDWIVAQQTGVFDGITSVLFLDEPENNNISEASAKVLWDQYIQPLNNQGINLGAPAISNTDKGKAWLQEFINICSDCTIDFLVLHWYGQSCLDLQNYVSSIYTTYGKNVWVTEWACVGSNCTSANIGDFVQCTAEWLDNQSYVTRFSYFGSTVVLGSVPLTNSLLSDNGQDNTPLGITYVQNTYQSTPN